MKCREICHENLSNNSAETSSSDENTDINNLSSLDPMVGIRSMQLVDGVGRSRYLLSLEDTQDFQHFKTPISDGM